MRYRARPRLSLTSNNKRMDYFPIFCQLNGKRCLIVGGGQVATHKARGLLQAGATLRVVAPALTPELDQLRTEHAIEWSSDPFSSQHLQHCWLVIAATNDPQVNQQVSQAAEEARLFCNRVDDPSSASFITPAIIDHSPVIIALCSGGHAPVYSQILKQHLTEHLPERMRERVQLAATLRERVNQSGESRERKRAFWVAFFQHPPLQHALMQQNATAIQLQVEGLIRRYLSIDTTRDHS